MRGRMRGGRNKNSPVGEIALIVSFAPHGNGVCCWCICVVVGTSPTSHIVISSKYTTRVYLEHCFKDDCVYVTVFSKSNGAIISQDPGWSTSDPIWRRPICRSVNDEPVYRTHLWQGLSEVVRFLRATCIPFNVVERR